MEESPNEIELGDFGAMFEYRRVSQSHLSPNQRVTLRPSGDVGVAWFCVLEWDLIQ